LTSAALLLLAENHRLDFADLTPFFRLCFKPLLPQDYLITEKVDHVCYTCTGGQSDQHGKG
jgi:hypothetical protein